MVAGSFRLPPETAALLTCAVDAQVMRAQRGKHAPADAPGSRSAVKWPWLAQQRADALLALITGGGRPINASNRRRHPTARQKRVVLERDRCCVYCGSTDLLQYDHQPDYEQTRHTITEELCIRCAICHHKRHAPTRPTAG